MTQSQVVQKVRPESSRIHVQAPSRIHITLIDMHGAASGRVDGGVGISLKDPSVEVEVKRRRSGFSVISYDASAEDKAEAESEVTIVLQKMRQQIDLPGAEVQVLSPLGAHSGLGSKTALLLSVARAYAALGGYVFSARELARIVGRGGTSGIGVEGFNSGGLIVDCGHSFAMKGQSFRASSRSREMPPPPLVGRYDFPDWPILLVTPKARKIHGALEQSLFEQVCPVPLSDVRAVCHATMMMLIPGVLENDVSLFGRGINLIQECRWKAFEIASQSEVVSAVIDCLRQWGLSGVGMSSWGSSVYAIGDHLKNPLEVDRIKSAIDKIHDRYDGGTCILTAAQNSPHTIKEFAE